MKGLLTRAGKLAEEGEALQQQLQSASVELASFRALAAHEAQTVPARLRGVHALRDKQWQREQELQQRYKLLLDEKDTFSRSASAAAPAG